MLYGDSFLKHSILLYFGIHVSHSPLTAADKTTQFSRWNGYVRRRRSKDWRLLIKTIQKAQNLRKWWIYLNTQFFVKYLSINTRFISTTFLLSSYMLKSTGCASEPSLITEVWTIPYSVNKCHEPIHSNILQHVGDDARNSSFRIS